MASKKLVVSKCEYSFGWKPSLPDHRDHKFNLSLESLPAKVDPLGSGNIVENQGQLGSCTGHACTTALEIVTGSKQLSRMMAYYNGRLFEGTTKIDAGAYLRDVIKGFIRYGVAPEVFWPYVTTEFARVPSAAAYKQGLQIIPRVLSYQSIGSLIEFKTALAHGLPVVFGFAVPQSFVSTETARTGWAQYPSATDRIIGGHAVTAIGYDDTASTPYVWVRNSWGPNWGINGNFKMPYKWFENINQNLVSDCWVIKPKI